MSLNRLKQFEAIIFSDMHFYNNPSKSYITSSGKYSWFESQLRTVDKIFEIARERSVDYVIHNGDLFHEKTRVNIGLYNEVWKFFREKRDEGFHIILNTGNHDLLTYNESCLKPFSDICDVISVPTMIRQGDYNLKFIPYGMEEGELGVSQEQGMTNILFLHADIAGLKYGPMDYESGAPLKYQLLKDWDIVFNGHIHKPQELKNIVVIGSPMVQDWGEADEQKRIIHFENHVSHTINLAGPKFTHLDRLTDKLKAKIAKNHVDFFRIEVSSDQLSDPIFNQYNVFPKVTRAKKREIRLKEAESLDSEIETYVDITDTKLDKKKLKMLGKEIANDIH